MARYGIAVDTALGVSMPVLRAMGRELGRDRDLAETLWDSGVHEARILASLTCPPAEATPALMTAWTRDFRSWDLCDQCCMNLFRKTAHAWALVPEWAGNQATFTRRAGFSLLAQLAVSAKAEPDERFLAFFPLIAEHADDARPMVKKAVNWALRQMGKRSHALRERAVAEAEALLARDTPSTAARWIARDALRELNDPATVGRIKR